MDKGAAMHPRLSKSLRSLPTLFEASVRLILHCHSATGFYAETCILAIFKASVHITRNTRILVLILK